MAYAFDTPYRAPPYVGYSADPEIDAARNEDRLDYIASEQAEHDEAVAREEKRLAAQVLAEAERGDYDKLWAGVGYADNDREVMAALLACARGEPGAQAAAKMVVDLLANTYATTHAEVP